MLKVRNDQLDSMAVPNITDFLERALNFLYENFPESIDEDSGVLTEAVGNQLEKADAYGLVTEKQAMTYITSAWLLGPDFDTEFPAAQEMLSSTEFSADEKTQWLAEWTEAIFAAFEEE